MRKNKLNTVDDFFSARHNMPVKEQQFESENMYRFMKKHASRARLEAFVAYKHGQIFSLYSLDGKYVYMFQFNADKIQAGYRDSLRTGWKAKDGTPLPWSKLSNGYNDITGAYCIFKSKPWVDINPGTYSMPIEFLPPAVAKAKRELISAGNWFEDLGGKTAVIDGRTYILTLA